MFKVKFPGAVVLLRKYPHLHPITANTRLLVREGKRKRKSARERGSEEERERGRGRKREREREREVITPTTAAT